MRVQRNKQILHELEGGPFEKNYLHDQTEHESFTRSNSHSKNLNKPKLENVIPVTGSDMEILGPDYCAKRPVFLPPNQTRLAINGTMNMEKLAMSAYPLATGKN